MRGIVLRHPLTGHVGYGRATARAGPKRDPRRLPELAEGVVRVLRHGPVGTQVAVGVKEVCAATVRSVDLGGRRIRPDSQHRIGIHGLFPFLGSCVDVQRLSPRKVTRT